MLMACEIELEVGAGAGPGDVTARVVNAVSGGEPSVTTHLDVEGLLRDRDVLETAVLMSGDRRPMPRTPRTGCAG